MNLKLENNSDLAKIDAVTQSSLLELDCGSSLDFTDQDRTKTIQVLVSKLRKGGRILIRGNHIEEVSRNFLIGTIPLEVAISMLYSGRKSTTTSEETVRILTSLGLTIINVRIEGVEYFVAAERK